MVGTDSLVRALGRGNTICAETNVGGIENAVGECQPLSRQRKILIEMKSWCRNLGRRQRALRRSKIA